jgi:hypothetical protein
MRIKLKHPSKKIRLVISNRKKQHILRTLGHSFEAMITDKGLLLFSKNQKYSLSYLISQCVDVSDVKESEEWMTGKPVGKELI